ncbi:TniQ protein [Polaromonas sp. OV174]|uniref:TnsD family Tn7-like transposition protein n=1 Tax=Polaromonas sp. OV174 TaxID=1855300 RepID=UPI0008EB75E2|nr:TnsD family Tn7-like transposition protein [Polaromonas sp. OV174]SFB90203.1 TniQ protein [Polaromonas sp. OV174]
MGADSIGQLFDDGLQLTWLPDELLFSLASRYHVLSHNVQASQTCKQLFGNSRQGCAHDFPSRVDCFVDRTRGGFGDSEEVIRRHTILPFYLPFQSAGSGALAVSALRGPSVGSLKFQLGLLTSRFRAHHPLKACLECMRDDRVNFSVAYWHRAHQLPGVWICLTHHSPLHESTLKSTGVGRFSWLMPHESQLRPTWPVGAPGEDRRLSALKLLAEAATAITNMPAYAQVEQDRLLSTYRRGLREMNLLRGNPGRLALAQLAASYLSFVQPLTCIAEFSSLPKTLTEALAQVPRLVRMDCNATHPVRHLTLMVWIFSGWKKFWDEYCSKTDDLRRPERDSPEFLNEPQSATTDARRSALLALLSTGNWSLSGAARHIGVDPTTAMAWAAQVGISTPRRAKTLKPELFNRLVEMLADGTGTGEVAKKLDISATSVIKILRTQVGLHQAWKDARYDRARTRARNAWERVVTENPRLGVKAVRTLESSAYAWLYRHDRSWLVQQVSLLQQASPGNHAKTNWDQRDVALAASIQKAALDIANEQVSKTVTLWKIYQRLPELKSKLNQLDRLPLSKLALELGTRKSGNSD